MKCALCKKTFDNDNKGPHCKRFHPNTEDSIMVQERLQRFFILACGKDVTDLIDLEDVNMNSGDPIVNVPSS